MKHFVFSFFFITVACAHAKLSQSYPESWWTNVPPEQAEDWEILPQAATPGQDVILSKRTELGVFSNLAATPFSYRGQNYASVEGLWQAMKYPENAEDPRAKARGITWDHTREEVMAMSLFEAKHAGDLANANMKKMKIDWVSFEGEYFAYRGDGATQHYEIILAAMEEKLKQNPEIARLLEQTRGLTLRPDHQIDPKSPPAYHYYDIWMKIRYRQNSRRCGGTQ